MSPAGLKRISNSHEETVAIGQEIGKLLPPHLVVCLTGDLGAGKTTLTKGIVAQITGVSPHTINSPTFNYLHIYEGQKTLYHMDCYRLKSEEDFLARGLDEYLDGLCLIEWPERIPSLLPQKRGVITIEYLGENRRSILYEEARV